MIKYKYSGTGKYDDEEVESYGKSDWEVSLIVVGFIATFVVAAFSGLIDSFVPSDWSFPVKMLFLLFLVFVYGALTYSKWDDYQAKIILYKRYFTVNSNYIHYLGINKIEKDNLKGRLVVRYVIGDKKEEVVIKREKFSTIEKDFKIKAIQKEKFEKVSEKIISRAKAANPDIEVIVKEAEKKVEHESA